MISKILSLLNLLSKLAAPLIAFFYGRKTEKLNNEKQKTKDLERQESAYRNKPRNARRAARRLRNIASKRD